MPVLNGRKFTADISKQAVLAIGDRLSRDIAHNAKRQGEVLFSIKETNTLEKLYGDIDLASCLDGIENDMNQAFFGTGHSVRADYISGDSCFAISCIVVLGNYGSTHN